MKKVNDIKTSSLVSLLALLVLLWGCGEPDSAPESGLRLRFLPQADGAAPAGLACEASAQGEGLNGARGAVNIGAVRLRVLSDEGEVVADKVLEVVGQKDALLFEGIRVGRGYEVEVAACPTVDGEAIWVGVERGIAVAESRTTEREIQLLPAEGFGCTGGDLGEGLAFAAAFSPDGDDVVIAGGLTSWTGAGQATATARIQRFVRATGAFEVLEVALPSAQAMGSSLVASRSPGEPPSMLIVGGVSAVVEGVDSQHGDLLPFGPAAGVEIGRAMWVGGDPLAVVVESWPTIPRFAAGVGVTRVEGVDIVAVVGGITYAELGARISDTAEIIRLGPDGPVSTPVQLRVQRVGPAVVELAPGVLALVGGNVGNDGALIEVLDLRGEFPVNVPGVITPVEGLPGDIAALARPSAFPQVVLLNGGLVVVGGLPIFPGADPGLRPVASAAIDPVLFRLRFDDPASGAFALDSPLSFNGALERPASQRAFATRLVGEAGQVWFMGGVNPDVASPFVPRVDSLAVDLESGEVSTAGPLPYRAIGATSVELWDGVTLSFGGVVEVAGGLNQLNTTSTAVVRRGARSSAARCADPPVDP